MPRRKKGPFKTKKAPPPLQAGAQSLSVDKPKKSEEHGLLRRADQQFAYSAALAALMEAIS